QELGISTHFLSFSVLGLFAVASISYTANITAAINRTNGASFWEKVRFFGLFLSFMPISMGLSLYNAVAVVEGLRGKVSAFVRTPKYGITGGNNNSIKKASYLASKISWVTYAEGFMALVFATTVIIGIRTGNNAFVLFHSMLSFGFGTICYYSIKHLRLR
ncbi:MAG TPA: histidine kinase, partial [Saprospiraceae bacterium]|nr:histidine kinase [Saprospiraceae bacterium]